MKIWMPIERYYDSYSGTYDDPELINSGWFFRDDCEYKCDMTTVASDSRTWWPEEVEVKILSISRDGVKVGVVDCRYAPMVVRVNFYYRYYLFPNWYKLKWRFLNNYWVSALTNRVWWDYHWRAFKMRLKLD